MSASDLAAQYAADVDRRVQAALSAVEAAASQAKDDLERGVLNLKAESSPPQPSPDVLETLSYDDTASYNVGHTADAFAGDGFDEPLGDAPLREGNGVGSLLDFQTPPDEDGIPQWE